MDTLVLAQTGVRHFTGPAALTVLYWVLEASPTAVVRWFMWRTWRALIADIARTTDEKTRFAKYAEAQKILAEDVPALFLFQLPKLGVWNAKLKGLWENSPMPANDVTEAYWVD